MDEVDGSDPDVESEEEEEEEEEVIDHDVILEGSDVAGRDHGTIDGDNKRKDESATRAGSRITVSEDVSVVEIEDEVASNGPSELLGVCERIVSGAASEVSEVLRAESQSPRLKSQSPNASVKDSKEESGPTESKTKASAKTKASGKSDPKSHKSGTPFANTSSERPEDQHKMEKLVVPGRKSEGGQSPRASPRTSPRAKHAARSDRPGTSPTSPRAKGNASTTTSEKNAEVKLRSILTVADPEDPEEAQEDFPLEKDLGEGKLKKLLQRLDKLREPTRSSVEELEKATTSCNKVTEEAEELLHSQPPDRISQMHDDAHSALQELKNYTHQVQDDISDTTNRNEQTKVDMDAVAKEFRHMRAALRKNREQLKQMQDDIDNLQQNTKKAMTDSMEQLKERTRKILRQLGEETASAVQQSQRSQVDGRSRSSGWAAEGRTSPPRRRSRKRH